MASSAAASVQPEEPLRSPDSAAPHLQHPIPDLQSLQGAYVGNIERLEEHAERMSEKGSDLGEEIRKLQLEQKLSDSRRSSLLSASVAEEPLRLVGTRSRGASTSSFTNSIVDVNGTARWGGYSPMGYLTSPAGSLRSSNSQPVALQRQRSGSRASRLGQIMQADEEDETMQRIEEHGTSPQSYHQPTRYEGGPDDRPAQRSVSSFTRKYDQIAQEIQEEFNSSVIQEEDYHGSPHRSRPTSFEYADLPDRPPTAASTDTTHKLRTLWQDFDGTHCPDTVPEEEPEPSQGSGSRASSLLKHAPELPPHGAPPPEDGMVFYPAPVPRMLNLPKRLSKVPASNVQARRRTQLLESMQTENRKSAPWLSQMEGGSPKANRKSRNLANLPPQLRASAYFDQPAPAQEFEVKGESATDTLDNILEASAHAPVSAFTDHPFAGHVGDEVYGKEHRAHKRAGSKANELDKIESRKSRSSLNLLDTRRNSSGDPLNKLKKRNSSADLNLLTVRATESRMSLGDELDNPDPDARGPQSEDEDTPRGHSLDGDHEHQEDEDEEGEEEEEFFGAPTTLLAELQMRKQQQKSRNMTAVTAFPNGIHATLLELDAVAEVERKKRKNQKVNLAWEAQPPPAEDDSENDDVPLGMLFPGRDGLANKRQGANPAQTSDWDRPLGLIAQREMENNEPLSKRRTRLLGGRRDTRVLDAAKRSTQFTELNGLSSQHLDVPTSTVPQSEAEQEEDEGEGETLAQRMRRMKGRQALDDAIGDVRKSTVSGDFAAEMMSQLGVTEEDKPKPAASPANDGEEETLGQRRARLKAEATARGDVDPTAIRPTLRGSMSMADILGAHPVDPNNASRKVTDDQLMSSLPQGSLLRLNAEKQERHRVSRMDMNRRMSSFGNLDKPLLGRGIGKPTDDLPIAANIQAYKDKITGVGVHTPMTAPAGIPSAFHGGTPSGLNPSMSSLNLTGQRESYFPQAQAGMPMMGVNGVGMQPNAFGNMNMMAPPMMGMNPSMMSMPGMVYPQMGAMGGMRQSSMLNLPSMQMGGMGMPMGMQQPMMMEPPMDPRQRDQIDRWRQGIMH